MGGKFKDRARKMNERLFFKRRLKMISTGRLFGERKKKTSSGKETSLLERKWELEN